MQMKTLLKEILVPLLIALAIYCGFQATLEQYIVHQTSMTPNIIEGQRLFINKVAYLWNGPDRGDIVVFHPPDTPGGTPLIKRVIGLPGETVRVESGAVYINGVALEEPYIREAPRYQMDEYKIPEGQYFVLGDNRNSSRDSHYGWTVAEDDIVGRALFSVWPPGEWGLAPNYAYSGD
jgi:signal peptidase I